MGRERADVILIAVSKFIDTLRVARRCRAIIMQNFVGALVVDGTMAALAC
jgi:cation transport ATPase